MTESTAELLFMAIMGGAFLWWAVDLVLVLLSAPRHEEDERFFSRMSDWDPDGEAVIDGRPEEVSRAILRSLRQPSLGMIGAGFRAVDKTEQYLRVEKTGAMICNQPMGLWFDRAEFRFTAEGDARTRVAYVLSDDRVRRILYRVGLGLVVGLALPALIGIAALIGTYVVQHEEPAVRWQVMQSMQAVHFLWPPLLVLLPTWLAPAQTRAFVDNLLACIDVED